MSRVASIIILSLVVLLPFQVFASTAKQRPKPLQIEGRTELEVGIRGGYFFQLNAPVSDSLMEREGALSTNSLGIDVEAGPAFGHNLSVLVRFGYQGRQEVWESPDSAVVDDLTLVYSLVHLPSVNIKWRPVYERVTPYITAGGGLDLLLYSPSIHVAYMPQVIRLPGAGFNVGAGVEFLVTWRFAFVFDVRYHISLHGDDILTFVHPESMTEFYALDFGPVHHNLNLYAGIQMKM